MEHKLMNITGKRGAFTLVEVMILLVVLSLVLASTFTVITRKHHLKPSRSAVHGRYICYMNSDASSDDGYTYHEIKYSGNSKSYDQGTEECTLEIPSTAGYVYVMAVGGGGAGGNANQEDGDVTDEYQGAGGTITDPTTSSTLPKPYFIDFLANLVTTDGKTRPEGLSDDDITDIVWSESRTTYNDEGESETETVQVPFSLDAFDNVLSNEDVRVFAYSYLGSGGDGGDVKYGYFNYLCGTCSAHSSGINTLSNGSFDGDSGVHPLYKSEIINGCYDSPNNQPYYTGCPDVLEDLILAKNYETVKDAGGTVYDNNPNKVSGSSAFLGYYNGEPDFDYLLDIHSEDPDSECTADGLVSIIPLSTSAGDSDVECEGGAGGEGSHIVTDLLKFYDTNSKSYSYRQSFGFGARTDSDYDGTKGADCLMTPAWTFKTFGGSYKCTDDTSGTTCTEYETVDTDYGAIRVLAEGSIFSSIWNVAVGEYAEDSKFGNGFAAGDNCTAGEDGADGGYAKIYFTSIEENMDEGQELEIIICKYNSDTVQYCYPITDYKTQGSAGTGGTGAAVDTSTGEGHIYDTYYTLLDEDDRSCENSTGTGGTSGTSSKEVPDGNYYSCYGRIGFYTPSHPYLLRANMISSSDYSSHSYYDCPDPSPYTTNYTSTGNKQYYGLGLKLLHYIQKGTLRSGDPGDAGEVETIFARSFGDSQITMRPGAGGAAAAIDAGSTDAGGSGDTTVFCVGSDGADNTNTATDDLDCSYKLEAEGGTGGNSHANYSTKAYPLSKQEIYGFINKGKDKQGNTYSMPEFSSADSSGISGGTSDLTSVLYMLDFPDSNAGEDFLRNLGRGGDAGYVVHKCWLQPQYFVYYTGYYRVYGSTSKRTTFNSSYVEQVKNVTSDDQLYSDNYYDAYTAFTKGLAAAACRDGVGGDLSDYAYLNDDDLLAEDESLKNYYFENLKVGTYDEKTYESDDDDCGAKVCERQGQDGYPGAVVVIW